MEAWKVREKQEQKKERDQVQAKLMRASVEVAAAGPGRLRRMKTGQPSKGKTLPHVHRRRLGETEH